MPLYNPTWGMISLFSKLPRGFKRAEALTRPDEYICNRSSEGHVRVLLCRQSTSTLLLFAHRIPRWLSSQKLETPQTIGNWLFQGERRNLPSDSAVPVALAANVRNRQRFIRGRVNQRDRNRLRVLARCRAPSQAGLPALEQVCWRTTRKPVWLPVLGQRSSPIRSPTTLPEDRSRHCRVVAQDRSAYWVGTFACHKR